jgi:hypothetical protein
MSRALASLVAAAGLWLSVPAQAAPVGPPAAPVVDVVLCLDVSSSMNGLIDSAKVKLWDIVNDLGRARPAPVLRVGLYSYGHSSYNPQKGWVRKELDLTGDLDTVYQKLNALTINGGTEFVARVCRDAVVDQKWSENKKALRMIFVCGNEPADQDKAVTLDAVAKLAVGKDIIINTIHCKWQSSTANEVEGWKQLAKMSEGRFTQIDMNKGTVAVATPQDKKIEELSRKLNTTYVPYGRPELRAEKKQNQAAQDSNAGRLPGAGAARGISKGGALYRNSDWDLVDRMTNDPKFDITKVPAKDLPAEMQKLKPEERATYVKKRQADRLAIQKEIQELASQRGAYLKEYMKKNAKAGDKAFDEAVRSAVRDQANRKGIKIPE